MASEIANALWSKTRRGDIDGNEAEALIGSIANLPITWVDDNEVIQDALGIALTLVHPVYDCAYLALAHRIDGVMITADERFANTVASTEHRNVVRLLANFTSG